MSFSGGILLGSIAECGARQALTSPTPPPRKPRSFPAPRLDAAKPLIDAMLRDDLDAPRKQRHTARRVLARLVDEHQLEVSYSSVRDYVARRRPEIAAEAGRAVECGFVPQTHLPGAEAEVDFADLWIDLCAVRTKVFLFTLRLSCSGRAVHKASRHSGSGSVPRRPPACGHRVGRGAVRQDPLRQPQIGGVASSVWAQPN
jgi:hypothetical protein